MVRQNIMMVSMWEGGRGDREREKQGTKYTLLRAHPQ
jgi:hypothetical protein